MSCGESSETLCARLRESSLGSRSKIFLVLAGQYCIPKCPKPQQRRLPLAPHHNLVFGHMQSGFPALKQGCSSQHEQRTVCVHVDIFWRPLLNRRAILPHLSEPEKCLLAQDERHDQGAGWHSKAPKWTPKSPQTQSIAQCRALFSVLRCLQLNGLWCFH